MSEPITRAINFHINGSDKTIEADPDTPLLHTLRNELGLTAAHFGCGANTCGACHVIIDGHAVAACDTPLWAAEGKSITTVEGLGTAENPHALQQAFIDNQAMQCGYCISGILTTAAALLAKTANPTEPEVREALDRNLCRCGSHNRIVKAIMQVAGKDRAP